MWLLRSKSILTEAKAFLGSVKGRGGIVSHPVFDKATIAVLQTKLPLLAANGWNPPARTFVAMKATPSSVWDFNPSRTKRPEEIKGSVEEEYTDDPYELPRYDPDCY